MVDPGDVVRRALAWMPSSFASQSDVPIGAPRRFGSTEHLSIEAVAAYVDGELRMKAHLRAAHHLSICQQCAGEVESQSQARAALRESLPVSMPSALMGLLNQIPLSTPPESNPESNPQPGLADPLAHDARRGRRKRR